MCQRDPVLDRSLRCSLQPQVDRQLQATGRARHPDDPCRTDRPALGVDDDARLLEAAVEDAVVRRLNPGLADDRTGAQVWVRSRCDLRGADLAQKAEELAADRAARVVAPRQRDDPDAWELARVLVDEESELARDARQNDSRRVGRPELAVTDPADESRRRHSGEAAQAFEQ